ncbi:arsenate reductase/protein-tyrosine-phosphatase family protein [Microbacterium dextranolyticum]|uniref:protein-tyrosine-phosphatase n=1 Tax=Microbacterium dextranolyticum TaxID=36806 RepID=A0A9W6M500_9MICO|nr:low molecular weight phosphatase family protein [Microbacterium dextranolyticum]MBM7462077.1 protein-tyrosine phosphatase [Microbacterium dextranolyticum]GLJ94321.1 hypothetical protein GCM10017591_03820 [Microbacterium dextranolyticum]
MLEILTVCTGNICRSPLAAQLIARRLADLGVTTSSAGTRARDGAPMMPESAQLAIARGIEADATAAHRARHLTPAHLASPVLVLAMARDHRREVVELAPARGRSTFTAREFARLAAAVSDDELRAAADAVGAFGAVDALGGSDGLGSLGGLGGLGALGSLGSLRSRRRGAAEASAVEPEGSRGPASSVGAADGALDSRARITAALAAIAGRRGLVLPPAAPEDDDVIDPIGGSAELYAQSADELAPAIDAVERVFRVVLA